MIIVHMEGGCLQGIYTDIPEDVGKTVIVAHSDIEEEDEEDSVAEIHGAKWHLVAYDAECAENAGPYLFPGVHKWVKEKLIEGIDLL